MRPMDSTTPAPFLDLTDGGKLPGIIYGTQESGCGNGGDDCRPVGTGWSARGGFVIPPNPTRLLRARTE
jgi:hypothetical protein